MRSRTLISWLRWALPGIFLSCFLLGLSYLRATALAEETPEQSTAHIVARNSSAPELVSKDLYLLSHTANFQCADFACIVDSQFQIYSNEKGSFDFEFFVPGDDALEVFLNDEALQTAVAREIVSPSDACIGVFDCQNPTLGIDGSKAPEDWFYRCWHAQQRQFCEEDLQSPSSRVCKTQTVNPGARCQEAKSSFRGRLKEGKNVLVLKYRQPLEVSSVASRVNHKSSSAQLGLSYLLYPLHPWQFAERFRLTISVRWALPKRSVFGRLFLSDQRSLACGELIRENDIPQIHELPTEGNTRFISEKGRKFQEQVYTFEEDFPRIFGCRASSIELEEDFGNNVERFLSQASAVREKTKPSQVSQLDESPRKTRE